MSSGFIPAGADASSNPPDEAWLKAQQLVAAGRSVKPDATRQDDGKSLYEVLESNKAAKQEAFEESTRLKNQFRTLDDDEVDFLDSVLESTRAKEAEVRKETAEQLEAFRRQREAAEKVQLEDDNQTATGAGRSGSPTTEESWATRPKKRRREKDAGPSLGAKLRKMSSTEQEQTSQKPSSLKESKSPEPVTKVSPTASKVSEVFKSTKAASPVAALGLGDYSSDDD